MNEEQSVSSPEPRGPAERLNTLLASLPSGHDKTQALIDLNALLTQVAQARAEALGIVVAWAGCVVRLIDVAPVEAVIDETGIPARGHATPPERQAIRAEAHRTVARWLARDRAILTKTDRRTEGGGPWPDCTSKPTR